MSKQSSEEEEEEEEVGGVGLCVALLPVSCADSSEPTGLLGKLWPESRVTPLHTSASDGRARELAEWRFCFVIQRVRRRVCVWWGGGAGVGRVISGAASSMSAKTASLASKWCHTSASGEMERRGVAGPRHRTHQNKKGTCSECGCGVKAKQRRVFHLSNGPPPPHPPPSAAPPTVTANIRVLLLALVFPLWV